MKVPPPVHLITHRTKMNILILFCLGFVALRFLLSSSMEGVFFIAPTIAKLEMLRGDRRPSDAHLTLNFGYFFIF